MFVAGAAVGLVPINTLQLLLLYRFFRFLSLSLFRFRTISFGLLAIWFVDQIGGIISCNLSSRQYMHLFLLFKNMIFGSLPYEFCIPINIYKHILAEQNVLFAHQPRERKEPWSKVTILQTHIANIVYSDCRSFIYTFTQLILAIFIKRTVSIAIKFRHNKT